MAVAEKENHDPAMPMVVLSTAHAAKFPDAVEAHVAIGRHCRLMADLYARPERVTTLPVDQGGVERHILSSSRAAREGAAA